VVGRLVAGAVVLLSAASTAAAPPIEATVDVAERVPLALVLSTPKGASLRTSWSDVIRTTADSIEQSTDFDVDLVTAPFDRCEGRLACIVRMVRPDYDRDRLRGSDGLLEPFDRYLERLDAHAYPRFLVYIVIIATPNADRVGGLLLDTDEALRLIHTADRRDADWQEAVEAEIKDRAVRATTRFVELRGVQHASRTMEEIFTRDLRAAFEEAGHWQPYGALILEGPLDNAEVELDGRSIGRGSGQRTRFEGVRAGSRTLTVRHPDRAPYEIAVVIPRAGVVTLEYDAERLITGGPATTAVTWSGVGLAAVGAIITGVSLALAASSPRVVCPLPDGASRKSCGTGSEWKTLTATDGGDPNPSGLLAAPLGLSLIGAGGSFAIGGALSDGPDFPWIPVVVGVVLGGVTYGVAAALDGDSAFK